MAGDTIFAPATAPGRAGVAVVRISGPGAFGCLEALSAQPLPSTRRATLRKLYDSSGRLIDEALVLVFDKGASFTGESVVEFQLHGSPAVVSAVLDALTALPDTRIAEAGEFTRRALENGCLDLVDVEGLSDLLAAETEMQRRQAMELFSGALRHKEEEWRRDLIAALALLEATIDFADEEVPVDVGPDVRRLISEVRSDLSTELATMGQREKVRDGFEVALVGRPNVGKSSLLNALAGRDMALVTEVPGTTRDIIEVPLDVSGLRVTFLDTAGVRATNDQIEEQGISRALDRARSADLRIFLTEDGSLPKGLAAEPDDLVVHTKADLGPGPGPRISSRTGDGVAELLEDVGRRLAARVPSSGVAIGLRQKAALSAAREHLECAEAFLVEDQEAELIAQELRDALSALSQLVGRTGVEAVLDVIFKQFCLGK